MQFNRYAVRSLVPELSTVHKLRLEYLGSWPGTFFLLVS